MTAPTPNLPVTRNNDNTSQTTHAVVLPTIVKNDEVLAIFAISGSSAITWDQSKGTWIGKGDLNGSTLVRLVAYRIKPTSDAEAAALSGQTLNITTGSASRAIWHIYVVPSGDATIAATNPVDSGGNVTNPNPPSVSFTAGDYLLIAAIAHNAGYTSSTAATGYTTNNMPDTTATSGVSIHSSWRTDTAISSEDPGAWTLGASRRCVSHTFAIKLASFQDVAVYCGQSGPGIAPAAAAPALLSLSAESGAGLAEPTASRAGAVLSAVAAGAMAGLRQVLSGLALIGQRGGAGASLDVSIPVGPSTPDPHRTVDAAGPASPTVKALRRADTIALAVAANRTAAVSVQNRIVKPRRDS